MYENIPDELKQYGSFCLWRYEQRDKGKPTKVPYQISGQRASSTDKTHFTDFATAVRYSGGFDGIGLGIFDGFCAIDIDHCFENGVLSEMAADIVERMQSYTEISPSGQGVRIIFRAKELSYDKTRYYINNQRLGLEVYVSGATNKYVTLTGNTMLQCPVEERSAEIMQVLDGYMVRTKPTEVVPVATQAPPSSATEILELISRSKNADRFSALYAGDISGYNSHSEADMALCNMLAFWCRRDSELMDSMFRQSGLMREKWDRKQSGSTYGALTIEKAVSQCSNVYEPKSRYRLSLGKDHATAVPRLYTFDDTGNSQRFAEMFGESMKYNYTDKCWLYWDGRRWAHDFGGVIARAIDSSIEAMSEELELYEEREDDTAKAFAKHVKYSRSHKGKKACEAQAQHRMPVMPYQLDQHKMAFNTMNGVLALKTGELVPHEPKWFITKQSEIEYPLLDSDCPRWLKFLDEIFSGDKELIRYVQKAVGYSMTGRTDEQCAFFLFGSGRNGKSTFLDVVRDIMGDYAMNIQPETLMVRNQTSSANSDIARLKGARFVTSVEPNEGMRINEGLLKQLTGDDTVTARKLYGNEFEFRPEFKLWMATNHKPIIRGTDTGIWRRIHMIPFTVQIPPDKVDKRLGDKLKEEYPAILRWAAEGCILWQREGLNMPEAVLDMVREYRREMDVISAFLEDRCEEQDYASAKATHIYAAYTLWCDANNEYKMSNTKFGIEMAKRFGKKHTRDGWHYIGVRLVS